MALWEKVSVDGACVGGIWRGSRGGEDMGEAGKCHFDVGLCTCLKQW